MVRPHAFLSELVLNQIDHLLLGAGYKFCRFADDYVIAADSLSSAYKAIVFLSEKLQLNQGLALQTDPKLAYSHQASFRSESATFDG